MSKFITINIIRFIGLLLFQVLILNQIELHGFVNPFIYPLFILLLPFSTPRWLLMLMAFAMGMLMDMFTNTPGLHTSALVFMGYFRSAIISLNRPPGGYDPGDRPNVHSLGAKWFFLYAAIAIFLHHTFFFFVETYSLSYFFYTLIKIGFSTIISLTLIAIYQYLFNPKT